MLLDVKTEKLHIEFKESVEGFNSTNLRKTETVEKVLLPNAEGKKKKRKKKRNDSQLCD